LLWQCSMLDCCYPKFASAACVNRTGTKTTIKILDKRMN